MIKIVKMAAVMFVFLFLFSPILGKVCALPSVLASPASPSAEASPSSPATDPPFNYTEETLLLYNNTLLKGNVVIPPPFLDGPVALVYDPSNNDIYVANYRSGTVSVISGATNAVIATIPVGSHPFGVAYDPKNQAVYVANYYPDSMTIIFPGAVAPTPTSYAVSFTESGLPSGTSWSVTLNGQTQSSTTFTITFTVPAGTYQYSVVSVSGYSSSPSSGSVAVSDATTEAIIFTAVAPVTYPVTFSESGLPSGTSWSATLNDITKSFTTSTITFSELAGTYSYSVTLPSGYSSSNLTGTISVSHPATVTVTATPSPTPASPSPMLLIGVAVAAVVVVAVVLTLTRKRTKPK
ncbi:MAG: YncE family protein [Thermoprotei archaeon]